MRPPPLRREPQAHKRSRTGDERRGHGGPLHLDVSFADVGRKDRLARCREVHGYDSAIGERRECTIGRAGGHRDDVVIVERTGIEGGDLVAGARVARGADEDHAVLLRVVDRLDHHGVGIRAAPRDVDHRCAVIDGIAQRLGSLLRAASGGAVKDAHRHDAHRILRPGDTGRTCRIIRARRNDARDMRSVTKGIRRIGVSCIEVPARGVVDVTVVVIIETVVGRLPRVDPEIADQIRMCGLHP